MARPTTTVEIAFDAGFTGTPSWTDVTAYVRHAAGINIESGRGAESETCGPNRCGFVLDNSDGRFTPGNTSSPYYPNVTKGRRVRVRSTANSVTYTRFYGFIDDWAVTWPGKVSSYSDCQVTASSRLARLGRTAELRSIIEETVLATSPFAYYTLSEPEGSTTASDTSSQAAPTLTVHPGRTVPTFAGATGPGTDGLTATLFPVGSGISATMTTTPADLTLMSWFLGSTNPSFFSDHFVYAGGPALQISTAGFFTSAGGTSTTPVTDGEWHHLATTWDGTTARLYVDGVEEDSDASGLSLTSPWLFAIGVQGGNGFAFSAAHVVAVDAVVSGADIAEIAAAGVDGFASDTVADRLERYASFAGVAVSDTDFETGLVPDLAHIDTTGKTALGAMREVETTEGGVLFDALDGTLVFHDRAHRYTGGAFGGGVYGGGLYSDVSFTVSYSGGDVSNALAPVLDDQFQVNDCTATNADSETGRAVDEGSITDHGLYRTTLDLATTDADEPYQRASWVVGNYADPTVRVSALEVFLNSAGTTLTAGVLAAEVGARVTLSGLPSNAPASSMVLFVEGRSDRITADEDRVTLRTSPATLWGVWLLEVAGATELGDTTRLAY